MTPATHPLHEDFLADIFALWQEKKERKIFQRNVKMASYTVFSLLWMDVTIMGV